MVDLVLTVKSENEYAELDSHQQNLLRILRRDISKNPKQLPASIEMLNPMGR